MQQPERGDGGGDGLETLSEERGLPVEVDGLDFAGGHHGGERAGMRGGRRGGGSDGCGDGCAGGLWCSSSSSSVGGDGGCWPSSAIACGDLRNREPSSFREFVPTQGTFSFSLPHRTSSTCVCVCVSHFPLDLTRLRVYQVMYLASGCLARTSSSLF